MRNEQLILSFINRQQSSGHSHSFFINGNDLYSTPTQHSACELLLTFDPENKKFILNIVNISKRSIKLYSDILRVVERIYGSVPDALKELKNKMLQNKKGEV